MKTANSNWTYSPKKLNQVTVGDKVYSIYTHGKYPQLFKYEVVNITDVELQYPDRHWKEFHLVLCESIYMTVDGIHNKIYYAQEQAATAKRIAIYGFYRDEYVQEWGEGKVYADYKVALHSLRTCLEKKVKKNLGRMKQLQRALDYQTEMLRCIHMEISAEELDALSFSKRKTERPVIILDQGHKM